MPLATVPSDTAADTAPTGPRGRLRFLLNADEVATDAYGGLALLDFVRRHRRLMGTKEGCKEGDCGACTVLVSDPLPAPGEPPRYRPMTSCLMPLAEVHGRHVVTVEGIDVGGPSTVQRALVAEGASQCGFCTPGIAVSLTALLFDETPRRHGDDAVRHALSGHLCRCTGYRSLRAAGAAALAALDNARGVPALVARGELPAYFLDVPARLAALAAGEDADDADPAAPFVAGGTDLYVQRGEELPDGAVRSLFALLPRRPELRGVTVADGEVRIGALTTFEELAESGELRERLPRLGQWLDLVASWQIRNRSTVGGNLVNASPIGDLTVLLLALGATVDLEGVDLESADGGRRSLPLRDLYRSYKVLDLLPGELLAAVRFADLAPGDRVGFEKVSKRRHLDIATVNTAVRLRLEDGVVTAASLAAGGVAPIPLALRATEACLVGRRLDDEALRRALARAQEEIAPIDDVRGSAEYKRLLVRNLLVAHLAPIAPESLSRRYDHRAEVA